MKKNLSLFVVLFFILSATSIFGQEIDESSSFKENNENQKQSQYMQKMDSRAIIQEMQKVDPEEAQKFTDAIKNGDTQKAKTIYEDFRNKQADAVVQSAVETDKLNKAIQKGDFQEAQKILRDIEKKKRRKLETGEEDHEKPSLFERALSGDYPADLMADKLQQYGYDTFLKTAASFKPTLTAPVGPDYIVGPGDQFTLTLWGTTEGIFNLRISKEGNVTLPKVGVVTVAGLRFGELENTLRKHLSRYYTNFNLSIAMGSLKTITVYVVGEVNNPGSFSLSSLTTAYGALFAAGGPTKKGSLRNIEILRNGKVIKTMDLYDFLLHGDRSNDARLQQDDTIFVPLIGPIVGVAGTVYRPAIYELKGSESIEDVIRMAGGLMPFALASRLQVYRFSENEKKLLIDVNVPSASESSLLNSKNRVLHISHKQKTSASSIDMLDQKVHNMDVVSVRPLYEKVWETVNLQGDVQHPGDFQWRRDLKLKEIIDEGELLPTADMQRAEIVRLTDDFQDRKIISVNLSHLMKGDESQDISLLPKDQIRVFTLYKPVEKIKLSGEVMSPAEYEIQKGERLSDILRRAGGFTAEAYPYGIVFKRKDVKNTQEQNLKTFVNRMQSQILQSAGSAASSTSAEGIESSKAELSINQSTLENLKNMQEQYEGRVAINISASIDEWAGSKDDLLLKDGDSIFIPKEPQEVLVMGEVHSPGAQVYIPGYKVKDYINLTGGYTNSAEKSEVFVLKANGFAFSSDSPSIKNVEKVSLQAGDTVFVPQVTDRNAGMRLTKDIIDILFKTAVVVATVAVLHL